MRLSVVIPTYNEASIINQSLLAIEQELGPSICTDTEVLIADDGTDEMLNVIEEYKKNTAFHSVRVLRNSPPKGKGASIARAFEQSNGQVVGFLDADLSTPPSYIKDSFSVLSSHGFDIYVGSRRKPESLVTRKQFWLKTIFGNWLRYGANLLIFRFGRKYNDTQCGFKFFKNEVAKTLYKNLHTNDGVTDIEVLLKANLLGFNVFERGVIWNDTRESKRSLKRILLGDLKGIIKILWFYRFSGNFNQKKICNESIKSK